MGYLLVYLARRRDARDLRELIRVYHELKSSSYPDTSAVSSVFALASTMNASPRACAMLCEYPPIREIIDANRDSLQIRSFMEHVELMLQG